MAYGRLYLPCKQKAIFLLLFYWNSGNERTKHEMHNRMNAMTNKIAAFILPCKQKAIFSLFFIGIMGMIEQTKHENQIYIRMNGHTMISDNASGLISGTGGQGSV